MKKICYTPVLLFLGIMACGDNAREQQLATRELALQQKEKAFAEKEANYQLLQQWRDSVLARRAVTDDSSAPFTALPATIAGLWNSKVICTESSCPDYVIGDVRSDLWELGQDSSMVWLKVLSNNKLVRMYTGTYDGQQLLLAFKTDSAATKKVDMQILLNEITDKKIKGTRTVSVDGKCTAGFTVDLDRVKMKEK